MTKPARPNIRLRPGRSAVPTASLTRVCSKKTVRKVTTKLRPSDAEFWTIINELPDPIPVNRPELDAIESYFAEILDAVFDQSRNSLP
ncbi:hypothetical protein [Tardiphaga sp.]|uniref:hypothetical protein n=1 Tax=Tardiphaga sp. TaxID=1926292 RepID=UPI002634D450|nr:hypothetical protein [Tardiphaga sp.]